MLQALSITLRTLNLLFKLSRSSYFYDKTISSSIII